MHYTAACREPNPLPPEFDTLLEGTVLLDPLALGLVESVVPGNGHCV